MGQVGKGRVVCRWEEEELGCLRLAFIPLLRIQYLWYAREQAWLVRETRFDCNKDVAISPIMLSLRCEDDGLGTYATHYPRQNLRVTYFVLLPI